MQRRIRMTPTRLLVLGYLAIILIGTVLLLLPVATKGEGSASFIDALFASVSASCVTGLVLQDTYMYWSLFGQIVLLVLIQTGGIGFMTVVFAFWKLVGKRIGLKGRTVMQESVNAPALSGMVKLTGTILLGMLIFESIGAFVLCFRFVPDFGWGRGIYFAIFTSVSAFCNAGFDLMGAAGTEFASLTAYSGDPIICITVPLLIIIGGLGFFVWQDMRENRFHVRKYSLHTKLVLVTTGALILVSWLIIFIAEGDLPVGERVLSAFFTATSPRTAGFNVLPLSGEGSVKTVTIFVTIVLMLIGGSSGSTAGGIKTNTFAVLMLSVASCLTGKRSVECFGRRLDEDNVKTATQFVTLYLLALILGIVLICLFEIRSDFGLTEIVFEAVSAIGTVGLTLGITPQLTIASQVVLAILMYLGRVGCLTFMMSLHTPSAPTASLPMEKVRIG